MPRGIPTLGQAAVDDHAASQIAQEFPGGQLLGEIRVKPAGVATWTDTELAAQISMESSPPPWENAPEPSDARSFVSCPKDWVLHWINPRLLDQEGWRGWMPISPSDPRVDVKIPSMISPDNLVRRGHMGDILAYMPREWFEKRRALYYQKVAQHTQASVDNAHSVGERVRSMHPGISVESVTHPTHTMGLIDRDAP